MKTAAEYAEDFEPTGGVWQIHRHKETGELLGPSVAFGVPTVVVWARVVDGQWKQISDAEGRAAWHRVESADA